MRSGGPESGSPEPLPWKTKIRVGPHFAADARIFAVQNRKSEEPDSGPSDSTGSKAFRGKEELAVERHRGRHPKVLRNFRAAVMNLLHLST